MINPLQIQDSQSSNPDQIIRGTASPTQPTRSTLLQFRNILFGLLAITGCSGGIASDPSFKNPHSQRSAGELSTMDIDQLSLVIRDTHLQPKINMANIHLMNQWIFALNEKFKDVENFANNSTSKALIICRTIINFSENYKEDKKYTDLIAVLNPVYDLLKTIRNYHESNQNHNSDILLRDINIVIDQCLELLEPMMRTAYNEDCIEYEFSDIHPDGFTDEEMQSGTLSDARVRRLRVEIASSGDGDSNVMSEENALRMRFTNRIRLLKEYREERARISATTRIAAN
jgi:hypothetical protein